MRKCCKDWTKPSFIMHLLHTYLRMYKSYYLCKHCKYYFREKYVISVLRIILFVVGALTIDNLIYGFLLTNYRSLATFSFTIIDYKLIIVGPILWTIMLLYEVAIYKSNKYIKREDN